MDNRLKEGFNTIQMSAVFSEIDKTMYRKAFHNNDISQPVDSYWKQVDWCVKEATDRGLIVILNPIWKRSVNEFIQQQGENKCRVYGRWFAERYKDNPRVFYFIGGIRYEPVRGEMNAMGKVFRKYMVAGRLWLIIVVAANPVRRLFRMLHG